MSARLNVVGRQTIRVHSGSRRFRRNFGRSVDAPVSARVVSSLSAVKDNADVVVIGGGLAGLAACNDLESKGVDYLLLEASDDVGGRVRTDQVDGFLLDRGFAIFLTGYPEAQRVLDYEALNLQPFYAGADVRFQGEFVRVADPFRHPVDGILSLPNPIGSIKDKVLVGLVRFQTVLGMGSIEEMMTRGEETTILKRLVDFGFSDAMIDRFFRPFMAGIFFNRELTTSSRLFNFVMRMLATGQNCLPAAGIGAVSSQLRDKLDADALRMNTKVSEIGKRESDGSRRITLPSGETILAKKAIIVACEGPEASRLLGRAMEKSPSSNEPAVGTTCLYFSMDKAPTSDPILYLDGDNRGSIVNNCCFPSNVAPSYAPPGKALASVSIIGVPSDDDSTIEAKVRSELSGWFGADQVGSWKLLRVYRIPYAQPNQTLPTDFARSNTLGEGLFVAGDHRNSATFDGALVSGRRAAEAVRSEL